MNGKCKWPMPEGKRCDGEVGLQRTRDEHGNVVMIKTDYCFLHTMMEVRMWGLEEQEVIHV